MTAFVALSNHSPRPDLRPLRLALDRWSHELGLQEVGLSIRLVKASDLPANSCGMSNYNLRSGTGEIDVLRSDEYAKLPGCLDGHQWESDSKTTAVSMFSLPSLASVAILDPSALTRDSRL